MKRPILSHHLGMLRNKGIIEERREGKGEILSYQAKKKSFCRKNYKNY